MALRVVDIFHPSRPPVVDLRARQMLVGVIAVGRCEARGLGCVGPERHARRLTVGAGGVGVGRVGRVLIDAATSEPVVSARCRGEQAARIVGVGDGGVALSLTVKGTDEKKPQKSQEVDTESIVFVRPVLE